MCRLGSNFQIPVSVKGRLNKQYKQSKSRNYSLVIVYN